MEHIIDGWRNLHGVQVLFGLASLAGGLVFLVRLAMQFLGGLDLHPDGLDTHHGDPDAGFKVLSLHGIAAFFMMFGLVGLAFSWQSGATPLIALTGGCVAGVTTVYALRALFRLFMKAQSSGTIENDQFIGCKGEVYVRIPGDGVGIVQVHVAGRLREKDARSEGTEIATGTAVSVVAIEGARLVVRALAKKSNQEDK